MLTLGTARSVLWNSASNVPYSAATPNDLSDFDRKLNQTTERFFSLGTWRAMWKKPTLTVYGCLLTLPRGFDTLRGVRTCCGNAPIYSAFHKFASYGSCYMWDGWLGGWLTQFVLNDENAQTFVIPTGTFTLRVVAGGAETSKNMLLKGGFDEDGNEIFSTVTVSISGTQNPAQQYTKLPEIQKDVTDNEVSLYSVDVDTSEATLIAVYAPGETVPSYRQYDVGTGMDGQNVTCLCKLGFEPAISINDLVIPSQIGALKLGLQALNFEDKVDPQNAGLYWGPNFPERTGKMSGAIDLLDSESAELDAAEQPLFQVSEGYAAGSVVNVY